MILTCENEVCKRITIPSPSDRVATPDVTVTFDVPTGLRIVSATPSLGGVNENVWTITSIPPGVSPTLDVCFSANNCAIEPTGKTGTITISTTATESDLTNNTTTFTLEYMTCSEVTACIGDISGLDGVDGRGIASATYNDTTGILVLTFTDGSTFLTGDLRGGDGVDGRSIATTTYTEATGVLLIGFSDGTSLATGDLRGSDGINGENGRGVSNTTYDPATGKVTFGYTDFTLFATGDLRGTNGTNGISPTVAVGTVTTGAAGSSAIVTNTGTPSAAVFNFTIPRGGDGVDGLGWTSGSYNATTGVVTFASDDGLAFSTGDLRSPGASGDNLGNHTATTVLNMSSQKITNLASATVAADAVNKGQLDAAIAGLPPQPAPQTLSLTGDTLAISGGNSVTINQITQQGGLFSGTTDGSGYVYIPHTLGVIPDIIQVTLSFGGAGSINGHWVNRALTTSSVIAVYVSNDTNPRQNSSVDLYWTATVN